MRKLCVFCGSSFGANPIYAETVRALGRLLVERRTGLVYGGSHLGLMGLLADTVLAAGGEVTGVIPDLLVQKEIAHTGLSDLRVVGSMHERKAMMANLSDAFLALPGGYGTFEEFCEVITWSQLALHRKPCGLLNVNGYYDHLLGLFDHGVAEGFVKPVHRALVFAGNDAAELLQQMDTVGETPAVDKWILPEKA